MPAVETLPLIPHATRGAIHYTFGMLAGAMALYNLARLTAMDGNWQRHGIPGIVYLGIAVLEGVSVQKHW